MRLMDQLQTQPQGFACANAFRGVGDQFRLNLGCLDGGTLRCAGAEVQLGQAEPRDQQA